MTTTATATQVRSTKIDPAKLRLFSIARKSLPGSAVTNGTASPPLTGGNAPRGTSAGPRISRTNTATSQLGSTAARVSSREAYSREGSRASALTKRSLSSEDARLIMKERMSRPPDIAPVRGGNINIDNVTPEYVTEFWTRKKMESDEFKRRRLELNAAKKQALASAAASSGVAKDSKEAAAPAPAEGKATTTRHPLRVARPAPLKPSAVSSALSKPVDSSKAKPSPMTSPSAQPLQGPKLQRPPRTSSAGGAPKSTPVQSTGKGLVRSASATASPAPSQPVARRLLVGSALGKVQRSVSPPQPQAVEGTGAEHATQPQPQPATRTPSSTALPKRPSTAEGRVSSVGSGAATRPSTSSAAASSPPKGILASSKGPSSRGPSPAGAQKRVHIDPTVAVGSKEAPPVEGLESVF